MPEQQLLSAYEEMLQNFENRDDAALLPLKEAVKNVEDAMSTSGMNTEGSPCWTTSGKPS